MSIRPSRLHHYSLNRCIKFEYMNLRNIKSSNIASLRSAFCCRVSSPLSHPSNSQQSAACEATFVRFHGFYFSNSQQYTGTNRSADCRWKTQCVAGRQTSPLKPAMPEIKSVIELTDTEQKLFEELLESSKKAGLNETTLRCAGGWVRDKLMGRESLDIDIALDNMLGKEFADTVNQYLESHGKETHNVAVIMSNPDQSKHLETARMKIRGLWIDLVNLRSEEYAHNSRIPTMSFGTPEQDAFRRDFTINSLFYNINEGTIEDLTGRGVEDMKLGIIRTPLPAKETFLDDPLRVLRAVRFASRFGFSLDESLIEAASDSKVRFCLLQCFETLGQKFLYSTSIFVSVSLGLLSTSKRGTFWALYRSKYAICQSPPPLSAKTSSSFLRIILSSSNWTH
jgi:hypothetical protein